MVAMPVAFDQPAVAARIARAGVGDVVMPRQASPGRLSHAIRKIMRMTRYRESARGVQREIQAAGGARRAADLIEAMLLR
jgi:zeaxanthin glucosyltransferase